MIEDIVHNRACSGCHACYNVCTKSAIKMMPDDEGFTYPVVEREKCITCGLCRVACPILNTSNTHNKTGEPTAYALINRDRESRFRSASGGAFYLFAQKVMESGGVVYGAAFSEDFSSVLHMRIDSQDKLPLLQGSKYVQSDISQIFVSVRNDLKANLRVLFSGTPCQVAGLRSFLSKDDKNLLCVEFICHGVPSPIIWKAYLQMITKKLGGAPTDVQFRSKLVQGRQMLVKTDNRKVYKCPAGRDPYYIMFLKNRILRPSCYACKYKTSARSGDFTIADFWGANKVLPEFGEEGDMSLVIINSEKARDFFENNQWNADIKEVNFSRAIEGNTSYCASAPLPPEREKLFRELGNTSFKKICKRYGNTTVRVRLVGMLQDKGLLKPIKKLLKR